jgi:peptidoglycan/xylan/chitin deacetylase (PgdA/CDA1 family)
MTMGLRIAVIVLLWLTTPLAWGGGHCIILQYHHFGTDTPRITSVTPAELDAHLEHLARHEFRVLPLEEVVEALEAGRALPERCVSLTVDDAYPSVYTEAWPRLRERGWPLTVFLNTAAVDRGGPGFLSWDQVREMAREGVRFENHSHSHDHLIRRRPGEDEAGWRERVRGDIATAGARIAAETGRRPRLLAYPYGEYDTALQALVREMGLVAFGQQSGPAWSGGDFGALPRFPMAAAYAAMEGFRLKVRTLPLPVRSVEPEEPVIPVDQWRPSLTLRLDPETPGLRRLTCFVNGSPEVDLAWHPEEPGTVTVTPRERLAVGRNRTNCTLPAAEPGRFHWYSHNWIRRRADGSWYPEP